MNRNAIRIIWSEHLPPNVKEVSFDSNRIATIGLPPRWPHTIKILCLDRNKITNTQVVTEWPQGLEILSLDDNPLYIVPKRLPDALDLLSMSYTRLKILNNLPPGLKKLRAYYSSIEVIGPLPSALQYLILGHNILKSSQVFQHTLPQTLTFLNLDYNALTYLPEDLPDTLETLSVVGNKLTTLPRNLPASLRLLIANKNRIRAFDPIWKENQRLFQLHIRDNCVTENLLVFKEIDRLDDLYQANNWNQDIHHIQAWRIQKAFRVFKLKTGMRVWARFGRIVKELTRVAYCPELVCKYHDIETLRLHRSHWF